MYKSKIDVAVLIIFFNRPEQLKKVFAQVKKARPGHLLLYQDGARKGKDDREKIDECRKIVSDIDWDCTVDRFYQESNKGCDPSEYIAQRWAFNKFDKCIILEDDDIPNQSFFPFCKELLDYYENDTRINMICGMNNTLVSQHVKASYLFTKSGSIWGWASWRRVIDTWDTEYKWLDDKNLLNNLKAEVGNPKMYHDIIKRAKKYRKKKIEYYEILNGVSMYLNGSYNIVPKYNMISNCGIGGDTTHSVDNLKKLPRKVQKLFYMKTFNIHFPIIHPEYIARDFCFEKQMRSGILQERMLYLEGLVRRAVIR